MGKLVVVAFLVGLVCWCVACDDADPPDDIPGTSASTQVPETLAAFLSRSNWDGAAVYDMQGTADPTHFTVVWARDGDRMRWDLSENESGDSGQILLHSTNVATAIGNTFCNWYARSETERGVSCSNAAFSSASPIVTALYADVAGTPSSGERGECYVLSGGPFSVDGSVCFDAETEEVNYLAVESDSTRTVLTRVDREVMSAGTLEVKITLTPGPGGSPFAGYDGLVTAADLQVPIVLQGDSGNTPSAAP